MTQGDATNVNQPEVSEEAYQRAIDSHLNNAIVKACDAIPEHFCLSEIDKIMALLKLQAVVMGTLDQSNPNGDTEGSRVVH